MEATRADDDGLAFRREEEVVECLRRGDVVGRAEDGGVARNGDSAIGGEPKRERASTRTSCEHALQEQDTDLRLAALDAGLHGGVASSDSDVIRTQLLEEVAAVLRLFE